MLAVLLLVAASPGPEVPAGLDVRAHHHAGLTYVTWNEQPLRLGKKPRESAVRRRVAEAKKQKLRFRIYRSDRPIDDVSELEPIGEVARGSGWNIGYAGINPQAKDRGRRYVVDAAAGPLPVGRGLFVWPAPSDGPAHYAVTTTGKPRGQSPSVESSSVVVEEKTGPGAPVLQSSSTERLHGVRDARVYRFVRWEIPPRANRVRPIDYLVALPPGDVDGLRPAGLYLPAWGGDVERGFYNWHGHERGAALIASNQEPYDWWLGYHELLDVEPARRETWGDRSVRPYTQARLLDFLSFAAKRFDLDDTRIFVAGTSMGGTGTSFLATHHPERFAWARADVGVHRPAEARAFRGSFRRAWGDPRWATRLDDGPLVFEARDNAMWIRSDPSREVPLLLVGNGVDDKNVGWAQARDFALALQEARQPHVFVWGHRAHAQRALFPGGGTRDLPFDLRRDQSLPAFTNCSLDDDLRRPKKRRRPEQLNLWLLWNPDTIVDEESRWEVELRLHQRSPKKTATVDVTPRRTQSFTPAPGTRLRYVVGAQSGEIVVDEHRRATVPGVRVGREARRLAISVLDDR